MTTEQYNDARLETELTNFINRIRSLVSEQTRSAYDAGKSFGRNEHLNELRKWAEQELEGYEGEARPTSEG